MPVLMPLAPLTMPATRSCRKRGAEFELAGMLLVNHHHGTFFDLLLLHRKRLGEIATAANRQRTNAGGTADEQAVRIKGHQHLAAAAVVVIVAVNSALEPGKAIRAAAAATVVKRRVLHADAEISGGTADPTRARDADPTARRNQFSCRCRHCPEVSTVMPLSGRHGARSETSQ